MTNIDIKENNLYRLDSRLLDILLADRTTKKNLIWATDNYASRGVGYQSGDQISVFSIIKRNGSIIKPRVEKSKKEQSERVKSKAEVFTPSWICNAQNNLIDNAWFERENVFNIEMEKGWVIYRNTQEAIIDEKTFETVQQMRNVKRAYTKYNEPNMFSGLLFCADCGNRLTIQRVAKNRNMDNFTCATYRKKKKGLCSSHRILVSELTEVVKSDLQKVCEYVFLHEKEFTDEYLSGSKKETEKFQTKTKAEIKRLSDRQEEIGRIIRKLYEDSVSGRITDERFDFLAKSYDDEGNDLKQKILELQNALAASVQDEEKLSKFLKVVKSYTEIRELTPEILNSFIEKIYIGETEKYNGRKMQEVEIIYKFVGAINLPQYNSY